LVYVIIVVGVHTLSACLYYIAKALERDPSYVKGIVFKEKILADNTYLQPMAADLFQNW